MSESWTSLKEAKVVARTQQMLEALRTPSATKRVRPETELDTDSMLVGAGVALLGPQQTRAAIDPLVPLCDLAARNLKRRFPTSPTKFGTGLLSFLSTAECVGVTWPVPLAGAPAERWLGLLARDRELLFPSDRLRASLAAVALGFVDLVPKLVGGGALPRRFAPQKVPSGDAREYVRHVATAAKNGARAEDVARAWESFLASFPHNYEHDTLSWPDLVWAARIHFAVFEKRPLRDVGAALHGAVAPLT